MSTPILRLSGIRFTYPPGTDGISPAPVLDGLALELAAGARIGLTGANGAGKSTLFQLIVGLRRPQSGSIEAFGHPCAREADFRLARRRIGLLFQESDDQLFCPTVIEDVAFGPLNHGKTPNAARAIAEKTLAALGLDRLAGRVTHHLSGGQKRLVALASLLAMDPDLLLLDEPTTALDGAAVTRLVEILRDLPQALVIITHDPALLTALTHQTLHLADGRLHRVARGPHPP